MKQLKNMFYFISCISCILNKFEYFMLEIFHKYGDKTSLLENIGYVPH